MLVKVAERKEFIDKDRKIVTIDNLEIVIFKVKKRFHAIDRRCTHAGGDLSKGKLKGNVIICPYHGANFNLENGTLVKENPVIARIFDEVKDSRTYKVIDKEGELYVDV